MKKIAKLSLVAAVAVAGLSTTSSAASLEEAIKGVDVSGQFRYRMNNMDEDTAGQKDVHGTDVEIEVGAKVPVTDTVTAVFKIDNANDDTNAVTKGEVEIEDYYFSYNSGAVTANFGQQNIPGRLTDGAQGDGLVALYNLGAATVGAAYFINHSIANSGENVASVIAMGNVGPVSLLAQYADVDNLAKSYNLKADASIEMVKAGVEFTETELDAGANKDDRTTLKTYVSANAGIVSATLTYAKTGDNNSGSLDNQINTETETPSEYLLWNVGTASRADFDVWAIDATAKVTDKISLRAAYADGEEGNGANNDVTELLGQVSYKVSKNLNTYLRYASVDDKGQEYDRSRIEVKYSF